MNIAINKAHNKTAAIAAAYLLGSAPVACISADHRAGVRLSEAIDALKYCGVHDGQIVDACLDAGIAGHIIVAELARLLGWCEAARIAALNGVDVGDIASAIVRAQIPDEDAFLAISKVANELDAVRLLWGAGLQGEKIASGMLAHIPLDMAIKPISYALGVDGAVEALHKAGVDAISIARALWGSRGLGLSEHDAASAMLGAFNPQDVADALSCVLCIDRDAAMKIVNAFDAVEDET